LGRLRPGALCNQRLWAGPQEAGVGTGSTNQEGVMAAQGLWRWWGRGCLYTADALPLRSEEAKLMSP